MFILILQALDNKRLVPFEINCVLIGTSFFAAQVVSKMLMLKLYRLV
jgi:hypothetical protein